MATQTASNSFSIPSVNGGMPQSAHIGPAFKSPPRLPPRAVWPWPTFLLGIIALAAVWYVRPLIRPTPTSRAQREVAELRKMVDRTPVEFDRAIAMGNHIVEQGDRFPQFVGEAEYLLGCLHLRKAEETTPEPDPTELKSAIAAFEKAEVGGVPDADQPKLAHKFGKAMHLAKMDPVKTLQRLKNGDDLDNPAERYQLLAEAHLRVEPPDLRAALDATQHQINSFNGTDPKVEAQARMRLADLHFKLNNPTEARKALQKIDATAPAEMYMASRILLARCLQGETRYAEAAIAWETVRNNGKLSPAERGEVLYELGFCRLRVNQPTEAVAAWTQAQIQGGDAGQAAGLRLAEMQLTNSGERAAAIDSLERALENVVKPEDYHNAVIPRDEAARFLAQSVKTCQDQGDFASASKLAELYVRLAPIKGRELVAEISAAWGMALWAEAQKGSPTAKQAIEEAKKQMRKAGTACADAATEDRPVAERVDCLRRSFAHFFKAGEKLDIECGLTQLERIEKIAPAALEGEVPYLKALARQNLGQKIQAIEEYRNISKQDNNPFAPRARYQLALLLMEDRLPDRKEEDAKLDQVSEELSKNMTLAIQDKDRETHEMSMYLLGEIAYSRRDYAKAEAKLDQALRNYPNSPKVLQAKFMLGRCNWSQARREVHLLTDPNLPEKDKFAASERYHKFLEKARFPFEEVEAVLLERDAKKPLGEADRVLLRQAQFSVAECCFFMEDYSEAIRRYKLLRQRHANQFEELIVLSQLWQCYNYLKDPESGKPVVDAMRDLLKALPDAAFDGTLPEKTRGYWQKWLDQVAQISAPMGTP